MLKAEIRNYGKIERADIELTGIVPIFGENRAGKSTLCRGIAEALVQASLPPKKKSKRPRVGGQGESIVKVYDDETGAYILMNYPSNKGESYKWNVIATNESTGLVNPCELEPKAFNKLLLDTLKMQPTEEEFYEAVKPAGYADGVIKKIWELITKGGDDGWTTAHASKVEEGKIFKRDWEKITGEGFKPSTGPNWMPKGWDGDLDNADITIDSLTRELQAEQHAIEDLLKAQGISESEMNDLQETFLGLPALREAYLEADKEVDAAMAAHQAAVEAYKKLPKAEKIEDLTRLCCAHCGKDNVLIDDKLVKPETINQPNAEVQAARKKALAEATKNGLELRAVADEKIGKRATLKSEIERAEAAGKKITESKVGVANAEKAIHEQRVRIQTAQSRLDIFKLRQQARDAFDIWKKNQILIDVLDVSGLRKKKLITALADFNASLEEICNKVGWPIVRISSDLVITCDGFEYTDESGGGKFIMRAVMQLCFAYYQKAHITIFDGADILVGEGTGKLLDILLDFDMVAVINVARGSIEECSSYRAIGLGRSYWIQDGVATEIEDAEETEEE